MKNKNRILTESQKREIIKDKEKMIIESFAKNFNKIKRIDENEIGQESNFKTPEEAFDYTIKRIYKMGYSVDLCTFDKIYPNFIDYVYDVNIGEANSASISLYNTPQQDCYPSNSVGSMYIKITKVSEDDYKVTTELNNMNNEIEERYIQSKVLLTEIKYDTRKDLEGYVDAEELVGKYLWLHTNRTHRNNGYNGMIGIYTATKNGRKDKLTNNYTNEVRIQGPIYFQTSDSGAELIKKSKEELGGAGRRVLIAGVSGTVIPTGGSGNSGMVEAGFNPFDNVAPWFHLKNDVDKKEIISADEVYFHASEEGTWSFFIKNPKFSNRSAKPEISTEPKPEELEVNERLNKEK